MTENIKPRPEGEAEGSLVEVLQVEKVVRRKLKILHDISLLVKPNEFVVMVGQSGGGKTTLLDAIAGYRQASSGRVFVDGIDVYRNKASMRGKIGYVPQRDIIHMELTVYQALDFSAKLRLPPRTTRQERQKRIQDVMRELDLENRRDVRISDLSGGQQKRVSIGVELLTRPRLFFLDEPTSGLDPGNESLFMNLMRRLADQGRTVIMISHTTKNVMLADKVLFMDSGGYMAWYGPPREAMQYFSKYLLKNHGTKRLLEFDDIYSVIEDEHLGGPSDWADRFKASQEYQLYIEEPLQARREVLARQEAALTQRKKSKLAARLKMDSQEREKSKRARTDKKRVKRLTISTFRQFWILSIRNLTILARDRASLILMLLIAPAVGSVDFAIAPILGRDLYNYVNGSAGNAVVSLYLMTVYAMMVGGLSQMREFVKESNIYRRERLVNLRIFPYVASKVWVALLLAFYHAVAFTSIHYLAFKMPGGWMGFLQVYFSLVLAVMTGMMLGLMASAISNNPGVTPLVMIGIVVPMFVFSGGLAPIPISMNAWDTNRWSLQALSGISGMGSDVARDPCWQLSKDLRNRLTLDDKEYFQCPCMGVKMFDQESCNFPGLGAFYAPELSEPAPTPPLALPAAPAEPTLPDPPYSLEDPSNQLLVVDYLNSLQEYQDVITSIQQNYRNQVSIYQNLVAEYQVRLEEYQKKLADYTVTRAAAVSAGEGLIEGAYNQISWAWVNKDDPALYRTWVFKVWLAQGMLVAGYFSIILLLVRLRDVK